MYFFGKFDIVKVVASALNMPPRPAGQVGGLNAHRAAVEQVLEACFGLVEPTLLARFADAAAWRAGGGGDILRLDIPGDHAFVVAEDVDVVALADQVARVDGHFSTAAGEIDHELRDRESGGVPGQVLDDLDPFAQRGAEVGDAL